MICHPISNTPATSFSKTHFFTHLLQKHWPACWFSDRSEPVHMFFLHLECASADTHVPHFPLSLLNVNFSLRRSSPVYIKQHALVSDPNRFIFITLNIRHIYLHVHHLPSPHYNICFMRTLVCFVHTYALRIQNNDPQVIST